MTNPTAPIISPNVGVTTMRLLGASSGHRRWYGPKPPATMISGKCDVSWETAVEKGRPMYIRLCVLGPIIWKVPLTEKALFYVISVPTKTSVQPKPGPVIWKVPISKVPITVARLYIKNIKNLPPGAMLGGPVEKT